MVNKVVKNGITKEVAQYVQSALSHQKSTNTPKEQPQVKESTNTSMFHVLKFLFKKNPYVNITNKITAKQISSKLVDSKIVGFLSLRYLVTVEGYIISMPHARPLPLSHVVIQRFLDAGN